MPRSPKSKFAAVTPSEEVNDAASNQALALSEGLFAHQIEGVAFLLARRRCILADDMGLGKTRQSIVAMRHAAPEGPWLVVTPASVKLNWEREIRMVDSGAEICVVQGSSPSKNSLPATNKPVWVIVNYDILGKWQSRLKSVPWKGFIFDEAHYLKNHTSQRSKMARDLALELGGEAVVYALSGTPLTNRPRDLFPLLQLVQHPLGKSFLSFAKRYCAATQNDYGWVTDGASNLEELATQLHGIMIRRHKDDVLDLPPKLRSWVGVNVPEGTGGAAMRGFLDALVAATLEQRVGKPTENKKTPSPRRSARSQLLPTLTKAREQLAHAKVSACIEMVDNILDQSPKVIVFSCFDRPVKALQKHFGDTCVLLTGATPAAKRQGLVDRFQNDPGVRVFVANLLAGGIGLNLTAASHVVFNDLDWVPANHWQGEDRAYRIGQTGTVNIHYLVADGTLDMFVQRVLETKGALVDAVVDGGALSPAATRDVLAELEAMVASISPRLADGDVPLTDEEWVQALLAEVDREAAQEETAGAAAPKRAASALSREAILALARVLTRPAAKTFKASSSSSPGKHYTLNADSGDVLCNCPGFEFRGTCSHARVLKEFLVKGGSLPPGFSEG